MTDEQFTALSNPTIGVSFEVLAKSLRDNPDFVKCPRCWHHTHEGKHNHDGLCDRCTNVLIEHHPDHPAIPQILENRRQQQERWRA